MPYLWRWGDVRPLIMRAGELVTAEEAERRVLYVLRKGEHTRAHRHTSSTVYHVAEGGGVSIIGGQEFRWLEGDTFVVPSWAWHEHASEAGEAVLFSFSDRPVLGAFGVWREETA